MKNHNTDLEENEKVIDRDGGQDSFHWNPYADQPHNIAPKRDRFWHHFKFAASYLGLVRSNLYKALPVLVRYRRYKKNLFRVPAPLKKPFAVSVSPPLAGQEKPIIQALLELGISQSLVRIPSWESEKLPEYQQFLDLLHRQGIETGTALLQRREDVLQASRWERFVDQVFSRLEGGKCSFFEIGHAWNRTKWGVWDHKEYMQLAHAAFSTAEKYQVKLVGPAVIDFEFHLYPQILRLFPFDKISSLLYVDRVGAPENKQFGWDTPKKAALLRAIVDKCARSDKKIWITEVNWPLQGTGKYSPAAGKPNVSEEEQANFLVRYCVLVLATGFIERIYWWQLVAPGYGLIDTRENKWRKRPAFFAMKTMVSILEGAIFEGRFAHPEAEVFVFCKGKDVFAVGWTRGKAVEYVFPEKIAKILDREGQKISVTGNKVSLDASPKYIFLQVSA